MIDKRKRKKKEKSREQATQAVIDMCERNKFRQLEYPPVTPCKNEKKKKNNSTRTSKPKLVISSNRASISSTPCRLRFFLSGGLSAREKKKSA